MTTIPKILVVIGPTASGKSEYAVKLAKKYHGEIISADSRQVYAGLDIGTGKVAGSWKPVKKSLHDTHTLVYVYKNIYHYCIDYISPKKQYTVADFKRDAELAIASIVHRGKTPIICGGTGLYIDTLLYNQNIPEVKPNLAYRKKLEARTTEQLFATLQKKDPNRARNIDKHNPRRLIRALEIIHATGKPIPEITTPLPTKTYVHPALSVPLAVEFHYLHPPRPQLYAHIEKRLAEWLKQDALFKEIATLRTKGVSWKRIAEFGLEYTYATEYMRGRIDYHTMYTQSLKAIQQYAKRQETWFKKYEPHTI